MSDTKEVRGGWTWVGEVHWQIGTDRQRDDGYLLEINQGPFGLSLTEEAARELMGSLREYFETV